MDAFLRCFEKSCDINLMMRWGMLNLGLCGMLDNFYGFVKFDREIYVTEVKVNSRHLISISNVQTNIVLSVKKKYIKVLRNLGKIT